MHRAYPVAALNLSVAAALLLLARRPKAAPTLPTRPDPTILVVEDDSAVRHFLDLYLTQAVPARIVVARNGREALEQAALQHLDAALVDLGLPDMPGVEVIHSLRRLRGAGDAHLPVVILSGLDLHTDHSEILQATRATALIRKPIDGNALQTALRTALHHRLN